MPKWVIGSAGAAFLLAVTAATAQDSLADLVKRAGQAFDQRDCTTASQLYKTALETARAAENWPKTALFQRRIGMCLYRAGDMEAAFQAYTSGIEAATKAHDQEMLRENLHGLATALRHQGHHAEALATAQHALEIARTCGHPEHLVNELSEVGILYSDVRENVVALPIFEEMLQVSLANHYVLGEAGATENLAILYASLGQPEIGIRYLRQSMAVASPADHDGIARLYANLGNLEQVTGRLAEAQADDQTALRYMDRPESWRTRMSLLYNIAMLDLDQGKLASARTGLEQSLEGSPAGRDPALEAQIRATLANVLLKLGQPQEARRQSEEALGLARRSESPVALVPALAAVGGVYNAAGQTQAAGAALEEAETVMEALRNAAPGDPTALETVLQEGYTVYQLQVERLVAAGQPEAALRQAEKSKARVLNDLLLKGHLDEHSAMSEEERQTERTLSAKVSRLAAARNRQSQEAITDLELFRRGLYDRHPELGLQRADFAPTGPAEWRKMLPSPGSALLEYFQLTDGLVLFVVREDGVRIARLPVHPDALAAETGRFRAQLAARDLDYAVTARALYRELLAPAEKWLGGTTRWIVSPDGALWELPFQALIDASGKHVLETRAIGYTPSLTALWAIRQRHAREGAAPLRLLAMGNPTGAGPALPAADEEVRAISRLYPAGKSLVLTAADARQDLFRQQAPRAAVIHIATHADLNPFNPMYSMLQLSAGKDAADPGPMAAAEILRIPLHADLAVLSACETARGKSTPGEQLLGMGWALTGAGAAASVISQWKVDSAATSRLMVAFHRNLLRPLSPADALRAAALEVRNSPGDRNPFYWAAFVVLGDGFRN